ncbi:MAG: Asp-tRNA(Asn)/Glu-tRNA(Gln) amidotransferase subunit GatC [Halothiobacillaceae bacterium]|nr:MAG: Asp-tRNA(Asn)/Glu-tRNA(Gln) amidotransferase subunit GatC [Halothiobacillaceae bacterium]
MTIAPPEVKKIAHLARLAVDEAEVERYAHDLTGILDLVERMNQADVKGVEPMAHPLDMAQRLRPDAVTETDQRELFQLNAPMVADGLFLVPKVIES